MKYKLPTTVGGLTDAVDQVVVRNEAALDDAWKLHEKLTELKDKVTDALEKLSDMGVS